LARAAFDLTAVVDAARVAEAIEAAGVRATVVIVAAVSDDADAVSRAFAPASAKAEQPRLAITVGDAARSWSACRRDGRCSIRFRERKGRRARPLRRRP
jgi:hypothetical protein